MSKKELMKRAIDLSRKHMLKGVGGPFGAVITKNGKVIAEGWNQVTSTNDPTAHAEVVAIRKASAKLKNFDLSGCEIYTSCEPCPMCLAAIYWARLEKIYFANTREDAAAINFDDDFLYRELTKDLKSRKIKVTQIARKEALKVFDLWHSKQDKIAY